MKVVLYVDIYPGVPAEFVTGYSDPGIKPEYSKRYRVTFNVPDPQLPDDVITATDVEEIKDGN